MARWRFGQQLLSRFGLFCGLWAVEGQCQALAQAERVLPLRFRSPPFSRVALSVGHPNHGFQLRAQRIAQGPSLRIKPNSRDRAFGHPQLVTLLERAAKEVAGYSKGAVLLLGDMSAEQGGPISSHVSHQSGRDADVGFYARDARGRAVLLDQFVRFNSEGRAIDNPNLFFDERRNWLFLRALLTQRGARITQVFVSRGLRSRLLEYARRVAEFAPYVAAAAELLSQPEVGLHDDHFHVRIACPGDQLEVCRNEAAVLPRLARRRPHRRA